MLVAQGVSIENSTCELFRSEARCAFAGALGAGVTFVSRKGAANKFTPARVSKFLAKNYAYPANAHLASRLKFDAPKLKHTIHL